MEAFYARREVMGVTAGVLYQRCNTLCNEVTAKFSPMVIWSQTLSGTAAPARLPRTTAAMLSGARNVDLSK